MSTPTITTRQRVLVVLDVDGTISPIPPRDGSGEPVWATPVAEPVLAALHELVSRPGVMLGWVTSWAPGMLQWLVRERLGGRLDGPYLPDEDDWDRGWRARSIVETVADTGVDTVVWIDDMAVRSTLMRGLGRAGLEPAVLVIRPDMYIGVTLQQARHAARFIDAVR
ncbi:hypothetical protein IF188_06875 [Microbacterium sp. NEAU-LLC]|uniref:Secreted protein n=1 Tax=Microbacterium helvum TaxID=2773713 RepID=A0ABR8NL70_9MICO|nr:HAD domain-containing protein [Microbacterium helvum]MBD3941419.1 hypothetical protein [Microbacterium helvum]